MNHLGTPRYTPFVFEKSFRYLTHRREKFNVPLQSLLNARLIVILA